MIDAAAQAILTADEPDEPLQLLKDGSIKLGAANTGSLIKFMNFYQENARKGIMPEPGFLSEWIARRISDPHERQDCLMLITGGRGSGKSRVSVALAYYVSLWLERLTKKSASTFFTGKNVISLAAGPEIARKLAELPECSCVIVDDAGTGVNARDFATKSNKGILRIISTVRTKKLFIIFNAPARTHIDVAIRGMILLEGYIQKGCHAFDKEIPGAGYNIVRMNRLSLSPWGKEYRRKMESLAGPVDYFLVGNAPADMVKEYDAQRVQSALDLAGDVSADLNDDIPKKKLKMTPKENREKHYAEYGGRVRELLKQNPKMSVAALNIELEISREMAEYIKKRVMEENQNGV